MNGDDRWEKVSDAQESTVILLFKMIEVLPTVLPTVLSTVPTSQNPNLLGPHPRRQLQLGHIAPITD